MRVGSKKTTEEIEKEKVEKARKDAERKAKKAADEKKKQEDSTRKAEEKHKMLMMRHADTAAAAMKKAEADEKKKKADEMAAVMKKVEAQDAERMADEMAATKKRADETLLREKGVAFDSDNPEKLIGNINKLHASALVEIKELDYRKASQLLRVELDQYKHVIDILVKMETPRLVARAERKSRDIGEILYTVEDAIFVQQYQGLRDEFTRLEQEGGSPDAERMIALLNQMQVAAHSRLRSAKEAGNKPDVKKYADLLASLAPQITYYQDLVEYKASESEYNRIAALVNENELKDALASLKPLLSTLTAFNDRKSQRKDPVDKHSKQLFDESGKLKQSLEALGERIESHYEQLMENLAPASLSVAPIKATLATPELVKATASRDISEMIATLDQQFAEWENNVKTKEGKKI